MNTTPAIRTYPNKETQTTSLSYSLFLLMTFVIIGRPQEVFLAIQPLRPVLVLAIINFALLFLQNMNPINMLLSQSLGKKYLFFFGMMIIGIPFAYHRREAFEFVIFQYSINMLYFCFIIIHINSFKRMRTLVLTILGSIFFYGIVCLLLGVRMMGRFIFGEMYDPNDLAYFFVSLVPFAALFLSETEKLVTKVLSILTIGISLFIILLTASRGGLLGLITLLVLFLFTKLSPVKRSIKILALISVLIFGFANKDLIFTERNATLLNISEDYNTFDEGGRIQLWKKGIEFTLKRPITGVGAQCFSKAIGEERRKRNVQEVWQVVHNAYIQISSELGLIAFVIFLLMLKESFNIFNKVRNDIVRQILMTDTQRISGIFQIAFLCHLVVATFLNQGYSILFTLFFALAAVLDKTFTTIPEASSDQY